jgi:hypothetical protein
MKRVLAGLAGAVALAGMSSMGMAQAPEKGERPAAKREAQQPKAAPAPRAAQADRPAARAPAKHPPAAQRSRPQPPAAAQAGPRQAAERKRAQQGQPLDRKSGQQSRQAQDKRAQDKVRQRQAKPAAKTAGPKQVEEKGTRRPDDAAKGEPRAQPVARIHATDQQRLEVHRGLFRQGKVERITRNELGIALAVGNHLPRRHRLHRFTPALIALAPLYAAYSYIVVDDTICVVDSSTYVIVDMIEGSTEAAGPLPPPPLALALSPEQLRLIYASVPKDGVRTELRIRLAFGAEIPRSVELLAFPDALIEQVPQIASLRYIVVENDVVIVDPATYGIAMVISEGAA